VIPSPVAEGLGSRVLGVEVAQVVQAASDRAGRGPPWAALPWEPLSKQLRLVRWQVAPSVVEGEDDLMACREQGAQKALERPVVGDAGQEDERLEPPRLSFVERVQAATLQ
jgi:hypothetical protein